MSTERALFSFTRRFAEAIQQGRVNPGDARNQAIHILENTQEAAALTADERQRLVGELPPAWLNDPTSPTAKQLASSVIRSIPNLTPDVLDRLTGTLAPSILQTFDAATVVNSIEEIVKTAQSKGPARLTPGESATEAWLWTTSEIARNPGIAPVLTQQAAGRQEALTRYEPLRYRPPISLENWTHNLDIWRQRMLEMAARAAVVDGHTKYGLAYADFATAHPLSDHLEAARRTKFDFDVNARGIQTFDIPPTTENVPPYQIEALVAGKYTPGRPTLIYLNEATIPPFNRDGKLGGTFGMFLGPDGQGLGDVNAIAVRTPFQGDTPQGQYFGTRVDNGRSTLATVPSMLNDIVEALRKAGSGPIIISGYSLGGTFANYYRAFFDNGRPGQGADAYIPIASPPDAGFVYDRHSLADRRHPDGVWPWWVAGLAPRALLHVDEIAQAVALAPDVLSRTDEKTTAILMTEDQLAQGLRPPRDPVPNRRLAYPEERIVYSEGGHLSGSMDRPPPEMPFLPHGDFPKTRETFLRVLHQAIDNAKAQA